VLPTRCGERYGFTANCSSFGIDVGQTTVAKYMARRRRPPSQSWKTFLRNHADGIASIDLFVVPTISFQLLYGLLVLRHPLKKDAPIPRDAQRAGRVLALPILRGLHHRYVRV